MKLVNRQQLTTGAMGAPVYFEINFTDVSTIKAKHRLELQVYKKTGDNEEYAYSLEMGIPKAAGKIARYSTFTAGEYVARVVDKDNNSDVYGNTTFTVKQGAVADYKNNSTFVFCKKVDDNWNPVEPKTKSVRVNAFNFYTRQRIS